MFRIYTMYRFIFIYAIACSVQNFSEKRQCLPGF